MKIYLWYDAPANAMSKSPSCPGTWSLRVWCRWWIHRTWRTKLQECSFPKPSMILFDLQKRWQHGFGSLWNRGKSSFPDYPWVDPEPPSLSQRRSNYRSLPYFLERILGVLEWISHHRQTTVVKNQIKIIGNWGSLNLGF